MSNDNIEKNEIQELFPRDSGKPPGNKIHGNATQKRKAVVSYTSYIVHFCKWKVTRLRRMLKKIIVAVCLLGASLVLSGCVIKTAAEELYSLPQLPAEYTELQETLQQLLQDGAEYAAPVSGTNTQPVQMVDLNGDGQDEALAFFRKSADEKPLKIYIFSRDGKSYQQTAVIEGSGTSIYSIAYSDLNQDGHMELIVGWKVSTDLQALSVYALGGPEPVELMRTPYVKYTLADLDQDQKQEIVVFRADGEGSGIAEYYRWQSGALNIGSSAIISMTMAELSNQGRVKGGTLADHTPALFVTGVSDSSVAITDILAIRSGELTNITLSSVTGMSGALARYFSLYPMDINNDGVTEIPMPVRIPTRDNDGGSSVSNRIDWYQYSPDGTGRKVESTYHDMDDGWYLELPDAWKGKLLVTRSQSGMDEISVTFALQENSGKAQDFLRIYTITGESPEYKIRGNRFLLSRQAETVFAAEILGDDQEQAGGLTKDDLRASFHLITTEWLPGDN